MKSVFLLCSLALCLASSLANSIVPCENCPVTDPPRPLVRCPDCTTNRCKPIIQCNQSGNIPYPGDCSKFCMCDAGGPIQMDCPAGLSYDPIRDVCDWPNSSTCKNDDPYPGCNAPLEQSQIEVRCTTDPPGVLKRCPACASSICTPSMCNLAVIIPYPGDCSKFCSCDSLGAIEMNCPDGLVYDPAMGSCNWPNLSTCSNNDPYPSCNGTTTTTPSPTTVTRPPTTTTRGPTTTRPPTTTTTRPPTTTTTRPPTTTTTRPPTTTTTRPPTTTTTRPPTTTTTRPPTTTTTRPPTTTTRGPTTTTTTRPTTTTTRPPTTTTTRPPTTTTTRPPTTTTRGPTTTTRAPTTTTNPNDPNPTLPCETDPPGPLVRCPECANARCTPNMCNQAASIPFPGDCTKFCLCDQSGAVEMDCPSGLLFDPINGICNWPNLSTCSNNDPYPGCNGVPALPTEAPIEEPPCTTDPPGPLIYCPDFVNLCCTPNMCNQAVPLPFPGDCNKFCICDLSGSVEMHCPPGLEFDPTTSACNWPTGSCDSNGPYPGCGGGDPGGSTTSEPTTTTKPPTTTTKPPTTTTKPPTTTTKPPTTTTKPPTTTTKPPTTTTVRTTTTATAPDPLHK